MNGSHELRRQHRELQKEMPNLQELQPLANDDFNTLTRNHNQWVEIGRKI